MLRATKLLYNNCLSRDDNSISFVVSSELSIKKTFGKIKQKIHDGLKYIIQKHGKITFKYRIRYKIKKYVESYDLDKSFRCDVKFMKPGCQDIFDEDDITTQINKATSETLDRIYLIEYEKSFSHLVNIKIKNENEMHESKDMEINNMNQDHKTKTKKIECLLVDNDEKKRRSRTTNL